MTRKAHQLKLLIPRHPMEALLLVALILLLQNDILSGQTTDPVRKKEDLDQTQNKTKPEVPDDAKEEEFSTSDILKIVAVTLGIICAVGLVTCLGFWYKKKHLKSRSSPLMET
ncbi:unnamed protein product [Lymnaea stagnalis]|uniref:Uncharacterized protein n=1 Tax=Lymnaea stagnalis TaxID=6523 RepID=A0AAV2I706_LYMST